MRTFRGAQSDPERVHTNEKRTMNFYENQMFHIYNQGNNRRQIFFSPENYLYFLWKMRGYLLPFGDFITWCLMPNHFYWQFYVKKSAIKKGILRKHIDKVEFQRRVQKYGKKAIPVNNERRRAKSSDSFISLNDAIGDLLKGYAQAINKEQAWTGSLFREGFKANDGWINEFVTVEKDGKPNWHFQPGNDYSFRLICYIHQNPVTSNIVKNATDYEWSSAKDYAGLRNGTLCNLEMGKRLMEFM